MTTVEDVTGFPELLAGRVKTLHPNIHAGILARRSVDEDVAALAEHGIGPIDLVCVNLYPFERVAGRRGITEDEAIEMIDVGGPALLRAAAKNHESVTPVCRPEDYEGVLDELRSDGRDLARDAAAAGGHRVLAHGVLRRGDRRLARRGRGASRRARPGLREALDLPYGENPHQRGAYYAERGARTQLLSRVEQLTGASSRSTT